MVCLKNEVTTPPRNMLRKVEKKDIQDLFLNCSEPSFADGDVAFHTSGRCMLVTLMFETSELLADGQIKLARLMRESGLFQQVENRTNRLITGCTFNHQSSHCIFVYSDIRVW